MARVYTQLDEVVAEALERAPMTGLVTAGASQAQRLHALVEFANSTLRANQDRADRIAAYDDLAGDVERAAAIREANLAAAAAGIL